MPIQGGIMETAQNYFEAWQKSQAALFEGFIETTKKTQQMFFGQTPSTLGGADGFQNLYASWAKAAQDYLSVGGSADAQVLQDNLSRLLGGSNAYLKLYELWQPLLKAMSEKTFNPKAYQDFVSPAQYKDLLDKVFGFEPEAVKLLFEQAKQLLELYSGATQQFAGPWTQASQASLNAFPHLAQGHPEAFLKIFHSLFGAFDNTLGRAFHVPPVGKDREKIELLLRCFDDLSVYAGKSIENQHIMYVTGLQAFEKVVEKLAEKIQSGEPIKQFDEFFDIWIDVSEQAYFKLFQTEDYAKFQGELLDAGLKVRKQFFKIMEMQLYDLPIVLRSEMDDAYKIIYDLKKKVKRLEQQLQEAEQ
jgi:class III poly(R)-hydroxyalkanoic acid synthase PhaE subunit